MRGMKIGVGIYQMHNFELTETDRSLILNILGYLNYSSGSVDPQFVSAWNQLFVLLIKQGSTETWRDAIAVLSEELTRLSKEGGAFSNATQAQTILETIPKLLVAYREFHKDVLPTLEDGYLFNSFFMARVCRILTQNYSRLTSAESYRALVVDLNDFLGYRPIPVLEGGEKHEPNEHEWVGALPLYYEGAGVAHGKYANVIEIALELLRTTDEDILQSASFIPEKLREIAVDPRSYDFDHPVNRRVNYSFGTWDDRVIDKEGYFRRFILHRSILDAIMERVWDEKDPERRKEYEYESAAVLTGTILMASGICGGHVQSHDSTVTLGTLTPMVAAYRDLFYERLLAKTPEPLKTRLEEEAQRLFQPFAGVRHTLNRYLAKKRADQLQRFSLARTYARMGYFAASKQQTEIIETTASRILSQIDCNITKAHLAADNGDIEKAVECLPKIEDLLHRGLDCGAFPDPWFILGFDAQYSLFPSVENGIHDHRLDGLIDLLNDIFDLYSRLQKEAAALGNSELRLELSDKMSDLADWWDQFGSTEVSSVEGFSGQEAWESAAEVSRALAVWHQAGKAVGDVKFWKSHVERFRTAKAFVLLCEALLDKKELTSSSSLLIYWLNQADTIPLAESDYTFNSIVFAWMEQVWNPSEEKKNAGATRRKKAVFNNSWKKDDYLSRWKMATKFLDFFGENADSYWTIPKLDLPQDQFNKKIEFKTDNPILAEFSRRLILSTKYLGKTPLGTPKIQLKSAFKDAARELNADNLPTPDELEKFYNDNVKSFPKYITLHVFVQIILNEVKTTREQYDAYARKFFGKDLFSVTVSDPRFTASPEALDAVDRMLDELPQEELAKLPASLRQLIERRKELANRENELSQDNLWDVIKKEYGPDVDIANIKDLVEKLSADATEKSEPIDPSQFDSTLHSPLVSIEQSDVNDEDMLEEPDYEEELDEQEDDEAITGGDPTFSAAYENMSYRDTANDGVDDETAEGKSEFAESVGGNEFANETDRISDRLTFIFSTVKLWKFVAGRSPLLVTPTDGSIDDEDFEDARYRLEDWRDQALKFEKGLYELLDQASRYHIPAPSGTSESLVEYDQLRGAKEILLDRIIWTIVEVEDVIVFLKATLRDETTEKYAKPWKSIALQAFSAIFRSDVKKVRTLWPQLLEKFEKETLLYIPTARGGDAKAIVECRRLQQVVLCLLKYVPRLGLLNETFQLIKCVQKMEQIRLSSPGSITEFDRIVEVASRSITETIAESSRGWRVNSANSGSDPHDSQDEALSYYLVAITDVILKSWLSHSQQIRISSVEAIAKEEKWKLVKNFIQNYGSDLFTQDFLSFRNIRAILHQGALTYLSSLIAMKKENADLENGAKIVDAILEGREKLEIVASVLEIILECIGENYSEYVDYNSTTTQSDRGEKLFMLLDFLRILASYERISWNIKPIYWTHDSLIRADRPKAAELWKERIKQQSAGLADANLQQYAKLNQKYGLWLPSVYERLQERYVRPLDIAQMCGLVYEAITEVRKSGEDNPTFQELSRKIEEFAATPAGVGFELPEWLTNLQDEVILSRVDSKEERRENDSRDDPFESIPFLPIKTTPRSEIERQISLTYKDKYLKD